MVLASFDVPILPFVSFRKLSNRALKVSMNEIFEMAKSNSLSPNAMLPDTKTSQPRPNLHLFFPSVY